MMMFVYELIGSSFIKQKLASSPTELHMYVSVDCGVKNIAGVRYP